VPRARNRKPMRVLPHLIYLFSRRKNTISAIKSGFLSRFFYGSSGHGLFDQTKMISRCFFERFGRLEKSRKKRTLVWGVGVMLRFQTKGFVLLESRVA